MRFARLLLLSIIALCAGVDSSAQIKPRIAKWVIGTSTPNTDIYITNDLKLYEVDDSTTLIFRRGVARTIHAMAPAGAAVDWQIVESSSRRANYPLPGTVVASGTGKTITFTPSRLTDAVTGEVLKYDILLSALLPNGNTITAVYDHGILIAPPRPVGQNTLINLSTEVSGQFTTGGVGYVYRVVGSSDKSGDGGMTVDFLKQLRFTSVTSSDPENPVHIYFDPDHQIKINPTTGSAAPLWLRTCRNIYVDGGGDDTRKYGVKLIYSTAQASNDHGLSIETVTASTNTTTGSTRITIVGVEIDGQTKASSLIRILPVNTGTGNNFPAFYASSADYLKHFSFTNISMSNSVDEGFYGNENLSGSGASAYPGLKNTFFWNIRISNSGNEPIQISSLVDSEVHSIYVFKSPRRNNASHNNQVQPPDNVRTYFYRIWVETTTTGQMMNNITGNQMNDFNFFAAVLINKVSVGSGNFVRQDASDSYSTIPFRMSHVTEIMPNGAASAVNFIQKNSGGITMDPMTISNNVYVSNNTAVSALSGTPTQTGFHILSNSISINPVDFGFRNYTLNDYRPATLSSSFLTTVETTWTIPHPSYGYDVNGKGYVGNVRGGMSDYRLYMSLPASEITSVVTSTPVLANVGTPFANLVLPSTVLVNLSDGSERYLAVTWSSTGYNSAVPADYNINGTLTLPGDIVNTGNYTGLVVVTVASLPPIQLKISMFTGTRNTSTTSLNLSTLTGAFTMNIGTGRFFGSTEATPVIIEDVSNPTVNYIEATTTGYVTGTGVLSLSATYTKHGTATVANWTIRNTGWWETGSSSPFNGTNNPVDFGEILDINGSPSGLGLRALNISAALRWNQTSALGAQSSSGAGVYPNGALSGIWHATSQAGTMEIYEITPGTLAGRSFTIYVLPTRSGTGTNLSGISVNGGTAQNVNALGNISNRATFTNVTPVSSKLSITVDSAPSTGTAYVAAVHIIAN